MKQQLVIFAKAPVLGFVKRRLARDIGQVRAWQFYRRTLRALAPRLAADTRWQTYLATTGGKARWPGRAQLIDQGGGSLGERMARVMRVLPVGPVVIVGSDIPGIERRHIAEAFKALGKSDTVFGPAADGGYWLVGLARRRSIPNLFENVRWSTRHALHDTMANLDQRHRSQLLEVLIDVDDGPSYRAWRDR
ncbi:MAG: TIGR04282 family arsenosugar biosynthesis glycosyltransferase [Proteobacteria bacterium]|nr:TIGR04282 family arsenosugar biosynthesis glycosyltransferase [Pseudomonadota bacterium]